ncbi:metallophosphoesterase [Methanofollis liminatans DSM 4140]|uniref:Metallophosphoesterase n=1 Tax=Methanofollis liminatans DSM 4140 TaxID=28892 RepID=J1L2G4_9EURY|nr:DNA repair exonuclease [Methanofollis liminatans]EJG07252.1 metallophosphoesterase [Methanofollis liminatans DSM 4140]
MTQPPKKTRKISPDTLTFIHTADLHLGSPLTGIRAMDESMAEKLIQASYCAFDRIVDLAIRDEVDFVLIAGDLYDSQRQQIYEQLKLLHALERLNGHGIMVYIVCGNHDPHSAWSRSIRWPGNVHIMADDRPEVVFFEKDGEKKAAIVGVSYPRSSVLENLATTFPEKESGWPFTIGLLHATLGSTSEHVSYAPCSEENLTATGYDYWALGHIHKPAIVRQADPTIVYPGIPQGRDIGESGPRGCYHVAVRSDGTIEPTFVETAEICWETATLSIDGIDTLSDLDVAILDTLDDIQETRTGSQVCCRLTLTGRGEVHRDLSRVKGAIDDLADHLREVGSEVYIDRIIDQTALPIDREALVRREDLIGDILRISDNLQQDPKAAETFVPLFKDLFSDKRGKKCDPISPEEIPDLIREAETYLLDLLQPEERV